MKSALVHRIVLKTPPTPTRGGHMAQGGSEMAILWHRYWLFGLVEGSTMHVCVENGVFVFAMEIFPL